MANFSIIFIVILFAVPGLLQYSVTAQGPRISYARLYNSGRSGRLQFLLPSGTSGSWQNYCGTISSSTSTMNTRIISVVCHMLGYAARGAGISTSYQGRISGIHFDLQCTGNEATIADCRVSNYRYETNTCYHLQITCPICSNGVVRLTGGLVPQQGNVEVCQNGAWSRVCNVNWDYKDSFVVCRQLGFPATQAEFTTKTYYGQGIGFMPSSTTYNCVGTENSLTSCSSSSSQTCQQNSIYPQIHLFCKGELADLNQCSPGTIRLSDGRDQFEGRVEVCSSNGLWGTVSRSGWDFNDAKVACRQLGLLQDSGIRTRVTLPTFGPGVGPILLYNVRCTGSEGRLVDCPSSSNYGTFHSSDAGVRCQINPSPVLTCSNGDVRLVGGSSSSEGRVEMCYNGVWGSICNAGWNNIDAAVVCRQLRFQGENSTAITSLSYGEGAGPYLLSQITCIGTERILTACSYQNSQIGFHICSSGQDAGVRCDASTCNHGDVRLYGGYSRADGSAEICLSGVWTVMCSQNWGSTDSTVFCRQLLGRSSIAALYTTCCKRVPPTSNTALMSVSCSVTSNPRIDNDCNYQLVRGYSSSSCSPVTIGCYVTGFSCVTGALRLVNRDRIGMNEGTVEVCQSGRWGTITYTSWGLPDAEVVCRQLGYQGNWSLYHYTASIQNQSPHLLHQMLCNGNEASLLNCRYTRLSLSISSSLRYNSYLAAAVTCQGNSSQLSRECTSGDVRLANSSNNMEGRVEICTSGTWVSVCDSNWRSYETQAFCKQLGHTIPGSFAVHGGFYGTTNIPIIYGVTCNSNSPNINSCTIHHQSDIFSRNSGNCYHGRDVGVVCQDSASVFRVSVTSNATGPVQLGDVVELHCSISPDPSIGRPVQLLYNWRGENRRLTTSSPNWTVLIEYTHYETTNYICTVYINNHILATGSIDIHAKDFLILSATLSPSQPVGLDNLTLEANITSDSAKYIMRNLSWYFNGNLIQNSPNTTIYNDNKTLTTTDSTAGVYEVRYDGLLLANPYNSVCEKTILSNLRHYPLFKPMYYLINTQELMNQRPTISILFNGAIESVITFTNGDNFTLKAVGQLTTSIEPSEVDIVWYFNGNSVGSSSRVQNQNFISRDLSRTSSTYLDDGIYEALLVWNMNQECYSYYRQLSNNPVILARTSIEVRYFVSLDHSFSADKNALSSNEAALLRCSATIRYPPLSSISIVKNNITLQTTTGTTLSVRTGRMGVSTFGLYQCRVDTTGVPISLKLRIKEKVHLMIEFEIKGHLECRKNNVFIRMVEASVIAKLRGDCSCDITANDLQMSLLQCNNAQTVTFSTLVVFSSDSGDETASTLTNRLSSQVSASAVHLDLNGNKALITSACTDCSSHHGANAGIFFGGVIFSMVLIALLAMVVYIRYRRKSSENVHLPIRAATNNIVNEERYTNCDEQLQRGRNPTVYKKKPEISTRKKVAKPAVPVRTDSLARTNKTRVAEVENIDLELYEVMDGPDNIDQEVYEECA